MKLIGKTFVVVWGIFALLFSVYVLAAPKAHADEGDFIYALQHDPDFTFWGSKTAAFEIGYRICDDLDSGFTPSQIADAIWLNPSLSLDRAASKRFFIYASTFLCAGVTMKTPAQQPPGPVNVIPPGQQVA